jgi:hypothetical protein
MKKVNAMKKFLSLALVCIMMLSVFALASCQETPKTTDKTTTTTPKQEDLTRYTVTKDEWDAFWNSLNFTVVSTADGETQEVRRNGTKLSMSYGGQASFYMEFVDDDTYTIMQDEEGNWLGIQGGIAGMEVMTLNTMLGQFSETFDSLTFDEAKKIYTFSDVEYSAEYKFENGALVSAKFTDKEANEVLVSNIGTTVVDIPEYTISAGPGEGGESELPMTQEEWDAFWNSDSYTMTTISDGATQIICKTETKMSMTADGEQYYIEVVDGNTYMIINAGNGTYMGMAYNDFGFEMFDLMVMAGSLVYSVYDEIVCVEENVYSWSDEVTSAMFCFENGVLSYIEILEIETGATIRITNVGTTEVEVPAYTVI